MNWSTKTHASFHSKDSFEYGFHYFIKSVYLVILKQNFRDILILVKEFMKAEIEDLVLIIQFPDR
jgi:hypothetical protein